MRQSDTQYCVLYHDEMSDKPCKKCQNEYCKRCSKVSCIGMDCNGEFCESCPKESYYCTGCDSFGPLCDACWDYPPTCDECYVPMCKFCVAKTKKHCYAHHYFVCNRCNNY